MTVNPANDFTGVYGRLVASYNAGVDRTKRVTVQPCDKDSDGGWTDCDCGRLYIEADRVSRMVSNRRLAAVEVFAPPTGLSLQERRAFFEREATRAIALAI